MALHNKRISPFENLYFASLGFTGVFGATEPWAAIREG